MSIESLYKLTLNKLCCSMNEDILQYILKWYPPSIILEVIWKYLRVNDESQEFVYGHKFANGKLSSVIRGSKIAVIGNRSVPVIHIHSGKIFTKPREQLLRKNAAQTKFVDKYNFCNHFSLDLFFKLVDISVCRNKLFIIFQICIQSKGFKFPKQFAEEWIKSETQNDDEDMKLDRIEQGLKLGIFLGDTGWLNESALVLSHTYRILTTEWVCFNRNLELMKIIQCLTKWLLVVSNYHNFDEAKVVLERILYTIGILEKFEGRTFCIAYTYMAVSQYYYVLMDLNETWKWAIKAVSELHDRSDDVLKLLVISHAVKVCSVLNKLNTAKKLIDQLHTYSKKIEENIHVDILMNEACYSLKADLANDSINSYYIALDSRRNLFGYYNLHTATVFVDYAFARYVCDYSTTDFNEALHSIVQGIYIMQKIGLPNDNMLLVNAGRIKALILEEKALDILDRGIEYFRDADSERVKLWLPNMKAQLLSRAEFFHLKSLDVSVKAVGEKALLTAKTYCNLGRLYQSQEKYEQSEIMHLKAIEIKESIFGKDNPEVALSLGHLASLYTYQLQKFEEAELLYLRSKTIYETSYGKQYTGLLYDLRGLTEVYRNLNNIEKYIQYRENTWMFYETREAWLRLVHRAKDENCTKDDLILDNFKHILMNDCL